MEAGADTSAKDAHLTADLDSHLGLLPHQVRFYFSSSFAALIYSERVNLSSSRSCHLLCQIYQSHIFILHALACIRP